MRGIILLVAMHHERVDAVKNMLSQVSHNYLKNERSMDNSKFLFCPQTFDPINNCKFSNGTASELSLVEALEKSSPCCE